MGLPTILSVPGLLVRWRDGLKLLDRLHFSVLFGAAATGQRGWATRRSREEERRRGTPVRSGSGKTGSANDNGMNALESQGHHRARASRGVSVQLRITRRDTS